MVPYRMSLVAPFDLKISADCHGNIDVNLLVFITSFFLLDVKFLTTYLQYWDFLFLLVFFLSLSFNFFAVMEKNQQLQMLDIESTVQYNNVIFYFQT